MQFSLASVAVLAATVNIVLAIPVAAQSGLAPKALHAEFSKLFSLLIDSKKNLFCLKNERPNVMVSKPTPVSCNFLGNQLTDGETYHNRRARAAT